MKQIKSAVILVKVMRESMNFAYQSITVNKMRTFLSLFGITIGIFAIIAVFTILDSLEKNVRDSLESLGDNVVYVQKWPWSMSGDYPWWKYMNRPQPSVEELAEIRTQSQFAKSSAVMLNFTSTVKYGKNSAPSNQIMAISDQYEDIRSFDISEGRYFSPFEIESGRHITVLGNELANELFLGANAVGEILKIGGYNVEVIGVLKKEGKSALGDQSHDNLALIPIGFARSFVDMRMVGLTIMVKAKDGLPTNELIDELRGILRTLRRIKPIEEDDFALNQVSLLKQGIDNIFIMINLAGWIIGGFSILVGGFGIANIMFVSVKERTSIIGIQKALGAKNSFILLQFLYESVLLSITGGAIGLFFIFIGTTLVSNLSEFKISLTFDNILLGLMVSAIIGIISGYAPAWKASRLSPVEAINTKS
ncbi:MAG: ABC transporter permease [Bacteroidales bacterium]|jgi:putative ABC transport system permease protein|nr:ABC transporter permease [Bacteroidales bacterium]MDD4384432.1 ABC transporter permease [Bacteroidales bacterium]MDY0196609.1 ABC transporter permease [Tenuifilaceae bacterium]